MQQHLEAKRGALEKSLEQLVGQINRVNGAIAVVDELIAESREREEAERQEADPILYGGIDRAPSPHWLKEPRDIHGNAITMEQMDAMMGYVAPSAPTAPVEMLPVVHDEPTL